MPGIQGLAGQVPGELGDDDASLIDDGLRVILAALRTYGVSVRSGSLAARPAASTATLGWVYVATDQTPRKVFVDVGVAYVQVADPLGLPINSWITDEKGAKRLRFVVSTDDFDGRTFYGAYGGHEFRGHDDTVLASVEEDGTMWVGGSKAAGGALVARARCKRVEVPGNNGGDVQASGGTIVQNVAGVAVDNTRHLRFHVDFDVYSTEDGPLDVSVALVVNGSIVRSRTQTIPAKGTSTTPPRLNVQLERTFANDALAAGTATFGFRVASNVTGRNVVLVNSGGNVYLATSHEI